MVCADFVAANISIMPSPIEAAVGSLELVRTTTATPASGETPRYA
jgi:hypothetical protein